MVVRALELRDASMLEQLRDASVRDLRAFITERGFSYAGLLERHELEARAEEAAAAHMAAAHTAGGAPPPLTHIHPDSPSRTSLCDLSSRLNCLQLRPCAPLSLGSVSAVVVYG